MMSSTLYDKAMKAHSQYSKLHKWKRGTKEEHQSVYHFIISDPILPVKRTKKYSRAAGDRSQCTNVEAILLELMYFDLLALAKARRLLITD